MKLKNIFALNVLAATMVACGGGGDINLNPSTVDNSVDNSVVTPPPVVTVPPVNPCAKYVKAGIELQGVLTGANCVYGASFASNTNQIRTDLLIPELPNNGVHIFSGSLFIGEDVDKSAASAGKRIPQEGEGPTLTIAAGAKLAFDRGEDYIRIARGSKIVADGTKAKPIIFSGTKDLRDKSATIADRGLWGGIQINGNGLTNKCTDGERAPVASPSNAHSCHILSEGLPGTYGGNNNSESSGVLRYVQVKHAGFKVVEGNELNAITFNGVGSKTIVEYVQAYSTQDDAFEWFGGAVSAKWLVAVGVSDDAFDYTDGYVGNLQYALNIAPTGVGGNNCIEADNAGTGRVDTFQPFTKVRVSNLTCITNDLASNAGTTPSPDGASSGLLVREGMFIELYNSIVTSNTSAMTSKTLLSISDSGGPQTTKGVIDGWTVARSNIFAGTGGVTQTVHSTATHTFNTATWLATANTNNRVINTFTGPLPAIIKDRATNDKAYVTLATLPADITVPVYDVSTLIDFGNPIAANSTTLLEAGAVPATGATLTSKFFSKPTHIGAASEANDWVSGWTVGL
jgi:hypothetical protein